MQGKRHKPRVRGLSVVPAEVERLVDVAGDTAGLKREIEGLGGEMMCCTVERVRKHLWRVRFCVTGPGDSAGPEVYGMHTRIRGNLRVMLGNGDCGHVVKRSTCRQQKMLWAEGCRLTYTTSPCNASAATCEQVRTLFMATFKAVE